jgi:hypothetical protein
LAGRYASFGPIRHSCWADPRLSSAKQDIGKPAHFRPRGRNWFSGGMQKKAAARDRVRTLAGIYGRSRAPVNRLKPAKSWDAVGFGMSRDLSPLRDCPRAKRQLQVKRQFGD